MLAKLLPTAWFQGPSPCLLPLSSPLFAPFPGPPALSSTPVSSSPLPCMFPKHPPLTCTLPRGNWAAGAETSSRAAQHPLQTLYPPPSARVGVQGVELRPITAKPQSHIWKKFPSQPDFPLSYFCLFGNSGCLASGGVRKWRDSSGPSPSCPHPRESPFQPPQYLRPDHIPPPCSCRSRLLVTIFWVVLIPSVTRLGGQRA